MELLLIPAFLAYFVPTVIAMVKDSKYPGWIALLNVFLGWTVIGWIAALVWALMSMQRKDGQAETK